MRSVNGVAADRRFRALASSLERQHGPWTLPEGIPMHGVKLALGYGIVEKLQLKV